VDNFTVKFDPSGLHVALDKLQAGANEQVRPAAQAGAQVLYDEVLLRVPVSKSVRKYKGKTYTPGGLKASIYQVFSQDNSADGRATYHVSWNYKKAPHGHLVEYGTSRAPAHPFLRPAYDAKAKAALEAAKDKYEEGTRQVIAGLKS
jgi:HK97 gp10 family phage protein